MGCTVNSIQPAPAQRTAPLRWAACDGGMNPARTCRRRRAYRKHPCGCQPKPLGTCTPASSSRLQWTATRIEPDAGERRSEPIPTMPPPLRRRMERWVRKPRDFSTTTIISSCRYESVTGIKPDALEADTYTLAGRESDLQQARAVTMIDVAPYRPQAASPRRCAITSITCCRPQRHDS